MLSKFNLALLATGAVAHHQRSNYYNNYGHRSSHNYGQPTSHHYEQPTSHHYGQPSSHQYGFPSSDFYGLPSNHQRGQRLSSSSQLSNRPMRPTRPTINFGRRQTEPADDAPNRATVPNRQHGS